MVQSPITVSLPDQTPLIPYGTMLKENSRKWRSDDRKVMNWDYHDKDDYYIDPKGVRFNFQKYITRKDRYGFTRQLHHYLAESVDENQQPIADALTKGGRVRAIDVNPEWEFFKAQQREKLSNKTEGKIYARRKIDVESVFGHLKAYLRFTRFTVRGNVAVKRQMGFMLMVMNLGKVAKRLGASSTLLQNKWTKIGNLRDFQVLVHFYRGFVTAPQPNDGFSPTI